MAYTVYVLRDQDNKVYVGATSSLVKVRWNNGNGYRFCKPLWEKIQSQGWKSIVKEIVATDLDESAASRLEQSLISKFDSTNPEKGYNIDRGGVLSHRRVSESSRKKMSELKLGAKNPNYGTHFSEDRRRKISVSNTGKIRSTETRRKIGKSHEKPVVQLDNEGRFIAVYESAAQAGKITGTQPGHISKVCKHQRSTAGGFVWAYA